MDRDTKTTTDRNPERTPEGEPSGSPTPRPPPASTRDPDREPRRVRAVPWEEYLRAERHEADREQAERLAQARGRLDGVPQCGSTYWLRRHPPAAPRALRPVPPLRPARPVPPRIPESLEGFDAATGTIANFDQEETARAFLRLVGHRAAVDVETLDRAELGAELRRLEKERHP